MKTTPITTTTVKEQAPAVAKKVEEEVKAGPHLKTADDLTGFPVFPPGTKSLVSKYLTRDIWNKYKDQKDKFGFSFKEAVFSGCQNIDSGIGCYAGS